jgi:FPC/CPF motif-containing protein YcgG
MKTELTKGEEGPATGDAFLFAETARVAFASFVTDPAFPCLGAKAALNAGSYVLSTYEELASPGIAHALHADLVAFTESEMAQTSEYASFIAVFRNPRAIVERTFERLLWSQLQQLHELDKVEAVWDPSVSSDPDDARFSYSIGGRAYYVIGLHGDSSRLARRFPWPAMVFNPHAQFEKLRNDGKWKRMQASIRERDVALQGSVNPMLSDFGDKSEARQYSGRLVEPDWRPDFEAAPAKSAGCPFAN